MTIGSGAFRREHLSLDVPAGSYCVIMGKTGCGKTTFLETVCGLKSPLAGTLFIGDCDLTTAPPRERNIGYVPQDASLFKTMSVFANIAFPLSIRKYSREAIQERVSTIAEKMEIKQLLQRTPHGLSGGETKRVALARALVFEPHILCLDEPLSALDAVTHSAICSLLVNLKTSLPTTAIIVTHNLTEAKQLGDSIIQF